VAETGALRSATQPGTLGSELDVVALNVKAVPLKSFSAGDGAGATSFLRNVGGLSVSPEVLSVVWITELGFMYDLASGIG